MFVRSKLTVRWLLVVPLLLGVVPLRAAEEEEDVAGRLRDALRSTMLQLRDAQGQVAALQTTEVANGLKIKQQETQIAALTKQAVADRNTATNMIAELEAKMDEQRIVLVGFQAAIEKWKSSYGEVTALAQKKELERANFQAKSIALERQVQDQKVRNIKMFKVGMEILDRYEKFGLGDAILAREPFVGTTQVKFQNLIQTDQDKLADQRITTQ